MLDYNLPDAGEERRWYIKGRGKYRWLHLQRKFLGIWFSVSNDMIFTGSQADDFKTETRNSARKVLRELNVNFNLPTGEVK